MNRHQPDSVSSQAMLTPGPASTRHSTLLAVSANGARLAPTNTCSAI
jgi:hypothetical protein